jgi:AraC-like DNA-binding protein
MDVLSEVLRVVRLAGAVFLNAEFSAPFAVQSPPSDQLAQAVMPSAESVSLFHILAEGECWFGVEGQPPLKLESGDAIIFPCGDQHTMSSEPGLKPVPIGRILSIGPGVTQLVHGGGGKKAEFVCGYLHCDQKFNPLFSALPTFLCVRTREGSVAVEPAGEAQAPTGTAVPLHASMWLNTTIYYLVNEARDRQPGNEGTLARLTELMFVELLRHYMEQLPAGRSGWLAGLRDPQVGKALSVIHAQPAQNWTVEDLAREAGVSRSALADRFTDLIGESPVRYLTGWRMHLARQLLREGELSVGEIALRVGYDSEYAFNRAFKRHVGEPPATWRKGAGARDHQPLR